MHWSSRFQLGMACLAFLFVSTAHAQHASDIAREYNSAIQPINDQIEAVGRLLDDPTLSLSQASDIIEQKSALQRQADSLWSSTQSKIDTSFRQARDEIVKYNAESADLNYQTAIAGSLVNGLNNIVKYPTKQQFDQNKSAMAAEWEQQFGSRLKPFGEDFAESKAQIFKNVKDQYGLDLVEQGYSRVGTYNPYTGEYFYRYYDKDGKALWAQWKKDANGLQKYRDYVETYRRRRQEQADQLRREAESLNQGKTQFENSRDSVSASLTSIGQQAQQAQRNLTPAEPETPANSGGTAGGDGIRRREGYPIAPDHLKIPNYRGPRWVNGRLVAP